MSDQKGIPRREFVKSAVAIGGVAALSACQDRSQVDVPTGPDDPSSLPERQHAWNEVLQTDEHGNMVPPKHRTLLYLNYDNDGEPSDSDREAFNSALQAIERAYEHSSDGLLLTVSYSPAYFGRFDASLPETVDLPSPEALSSFEDPEFDTPDTVIHLASNHGQAVLGAEEALKSNKDTLNGVDQPDTAVTDLFSVADRRTGFIGDGLPSQNADVEGVPEEKVPEDAPLFMGFKSGFQKNQASEDNVTIQTGPFAGGTTQHISKLTLNLNQWYNQDDRWQREAKMFCPYHAENDLVEGTGDNLGDSSKINECPESSESARNSGVVGHSQKTARARDENNSPLILRRDFDSTDGEEAGVHFLSLQREVSDFVETREAMNGTDLAEDSAVGQRNNNGILQYVRTRKRGNFLVPPRSLRALPPASPRSTSEKRDRNA